MSLAMEPTGSHHFAATWPVRGRHRSVMASAVLGLLAAPGASGLANATDTTATVCDPYQTYSCLDDDLGSGVFERFINAYILEEGQATAPSDPNAPPGRKADWPTTPQTTPPMPFTEWPYGGTTNLGVNRTGSVDSPLMTALSTTAVGEWMTKYGIQAYGWVDPGFNVSSNSVRPGGNAPIAYAYTPNTVQLDQAVLYVERTPDTVQTDSIDWGFRLSGIYGENYRYTYSYGLGEYQLNKNNQVNGWDVPMMYVELYIPYVAEGLMIRAGRYISLPDIEAQLAPNNYMYTHSLTYSYDNYTNTGVQGTLALTKNLFLQFGVSDGTEAPLWHLTAREPNRLPIIPAGAVGNAVAIANPLYQGSTFPKDPGAQPTFSTCVRYGWDDGHNNLNLCANAINDGRWGYNNLQWYGFTAYHKWSDHWHISWESYYMQEFRVPNNQNAEAVYIFNNGGTPFSPQYVPLNGPGPVYCKDAASLKCSPVAIGNTFYLNYSPNAFNNISLRPEYYYDPNGWRTATGVPSFYAALSLGWQHWLSPQIEVRPEVGYYRSLGVKAFNVCPSGSTCGYAPGAAPAPSDYTVFAGGDVIVHF